MANSPLDDGIFREVDDDLKREKLENFWKEYGNTIIACVLILIFGTAINSFTQSYRHKKYVAQTDQLVSYVEEAASLSEAERIKKLNTLIATTKGGAQTILLLQLGAQQYQAGNLDEALTTYAKVEDADAHDIYEDLAELQMIRIRMEQGADAGQLLDDIDDLAEDDGAFRFSALELKGLLKKQTGAIDEANQIFQNLSMNGLAPESLRQRASAYIVHTSNEGDQS